MQRPVPFVFTLYFCSLVAAQDVPRCYYPNGKIATNDYACYLNSSQSFCCTQGVKCLDNKICESVNVTKYKYNRGTCTDKTWQSDECPKFCQAQSPNYGSGIVQCDSNSNVCCDNGKDDDSATCCQDDSGIFAISRDWNAFKTIDSVASTATRNTAIPSAATATTSATNTNASNSGKSTEGSGLSSGSIAGIAVGVAAGVVLAAILLFWLLRRRNAKSRTEEIMELDSGRNAQELQGQELTPELMSKPIKPPVEMSSGQELFEMEGSPTSTVHATVPDNVDAAISAEKDKIGR
ncbi:uncharacterized protein K452DRAFT_362544 [Aplosporella prunicola CBS 121167]|uniref:Mid2 domain-containing protein n=1 Tax=Aplosporella prunicola CBS 121167 TaxID=1176127 RepID=A0A6A6AWW5_9PEZI|nr:uncharacterized protein K452DRAFT_362544 [Aplosporella prunicola CBS 121167]KAF2136439.1 hypothetical protein K452DRAFT_362544 [Aplosporella prunicola CBS 121167]